MPKSSTIASLNRAAARSESDFISISQDVLDEDELDRVAEYWDRLNIPRSVPFDGMAEPMPALTVRVDRIGNFAEERAISNGIQKFLERHERKLKWHAAHPSPEGTENVLLLARAAMIALDMRIKRIHLLLASKDELNPIEWSISREIINRTFLAFRNMLTLLVNWLEQAKAALPIDDLQELVGSFYEHVDGHVLILKQGADRIEERRREITVLPDGFPPVRPPEYFGGDLLGSGPRQQYWNLIELRTHKFREALG